MSDSRAGQTAPLTPRLIAIITELEAHQDFEAAPTLEATYLYQLGAAQKVNVFEPFTDEQIALNQFLSRIRAGKALTQKAWSLYANAHKAA